MIRKISYPLMLLLFSVVSHGLYAQQKTANNKALSVERNKTDNTPTSVVFAPGSNFNPENAAEIFRQFLGTDQSVVKMELAYSTRTKQNTQVDKYIQYINGIKVAFGNYSIVSKGGIVGFMTGNYYNAGAEMKTTHKLPESRAFEAALKKIGAETYMWQVPGMENMLKAQKKDKSATNLPKGELVWIEDRSEGLPDRKLHLAYAFNVYAAKPLSRDMVYVDANTGKILFVNQLLEHTGTPATAATLYSGTVGITTGHVGANYLLHDSTRGGGVFTFDTHNTLFTTITNFSNTTTTWSADAGIDAHWGAENVYDYWNTVQGRNSFDNAGAPIYSYVHYDDAYDNAFWDGSEMVYGDGSGLPGGFSPLTSQDVCGHEIGHAVCTYTANLIYAGESGAMNEGFSDIWGAVIENWSDPHETDAVAKNKWAIGEEIGLNPLRRMDTPSLRNDPNTYNGTHWINVVGCSPGSGNDQCGVHTNSGVLNHWFYFLSDGGSGTNELGLSYSIAGVGINTAADIAYNTELALTSTADYALCRSTSINVATIMYGACSPEVQAVRNAWYAVGVFSVEGPTAGAGTITGAGSLCMGATLTLADAITGGNWVSHHPTIATVNASGVVTGVVPGVVTIFYSVMGTCGRVSTGVTITVNPSPSGMYASPVTTAICAGSSAKLKVVTPGLAPIFTYNFNSGLGSWTVDNTEMISADANASWQARADGFSDEFGPWHSPDASGFVQSNSDIGGEFAGLTASKLVSPIFSLAGYTNSVLMFQHVYNQYSTDVNVQVDISTDGGSTWSLLHDYLGTSIGNTNGFASSTVSLSAYDGMSNLRIRYNFKTDWGYYWAIDNVVIGRVIETPVQATWAAATGLFTNTALTAAYTGATVDSVYASPASSTTYTATVTNSLGCTATMTAMVNVNPNAPITGVAAVCSGFTTTLSNSVSGGTWSSSNTAVGTISSFGTVAGIAAGTTTISYVTSAGCIKTRVVTVSTTPSAISGSTFICVGGSTTLSNSSAGGVSWSSADGAGILTVGSSSGLVTGLSAGTATVTFMVSSGCSVTTLVTVAAMPSAISGTMSVCTGSTTSLSSATSGGTWSSSNVSVATVGSTGTVTGIAGGTATISYTLVSGCRVTALVTVGTTPAVITGPLSLCVGATSVLASATPGCTWSSGTISVATIGSTGIVSGLLTGTSTISYTHSSGCARSVVVTVSTGPGTNTGMAEVCVGSTTALSNATTGGTWSSSNNARATVVGTTGVVSGVSAGTVNITYTLTAGCWSITQVTVNAALASITGGTNVCASSNITFSHPLSGGVWTSSNTLLATVVAGTGVITGIAAGTPNITYTLGGCFKTKPITVNGGSAAITGNTSICLGSTSTLSCSTPGGTIWTSSNMAVASIGSTSALVTGLTVGTSDITYTATSGCISTTVVTVVPLPTAISGTLTLCQGTSTTLASIGTGGGTWTSSVLSNATIGSLNGIVAGLAGGTSNITYTWTNTCKRTAQVTVTGLPALPAITGAGVLTISGAPITLTASISGGTWASANVAIATVTPSGAATALLDGISAGNVNITYTLTNSCGANSRVRIFTVTTPRLLPGTVADVKFSVFPNPTSGVITIETPVTGAFYVYTIDGRLVGKYVINAATATISLPSELASGIYMCRFYGDDSSVQAVRLILDKR